MTSLAFVVAGWLPGCGARTSVPGPSNGGWSSRWAGPGGARRVELPLPRDPFVCRPGRRHRGMYLLGTLLAAGALVRRRLLHPGVAVVGYVVVNALLAVVQYMAPDTRRILFAVVLMPGSSSSSRRRCGPERSRPRWPASPWVCPVVARLLGHLVRLDDVDLAGPWGVAHPRRRGGIPAGRPLPALGRGLATRGPAPVSEPRGC